MALYLSLIGLWVLFFWLYRDYRVERFRHDLFELRDELFDLARAGEVEFASPAYRLLRTTINGHLQYGERRGLAELLCGMLLTPKRVRAEASKMYRDGWGLALKGMPGEPKKKLESIRRRMNLLVCEHIALTSSVVTASLMLVGFGLLLWTLQDAARKAVANVVSIFASPDLLDEAALTRSAAPCATVVPWRKVL